jgi:uncharacterized protein
VSIANKPKIIIAAIACRPYVEAAVACGYSVVAMDAFADIEVTSLAESCYQLELSHGQLNMHQLMQVINGLDLDQFVGFCYGAGFEKEPEMLTKINALLPVIGNLEQAVSRCKAPDDFFSVCEQLQVPYPKVMFSQPRNTNGWLRKEIGASGGAHIKLADLHVSNGQKSQEGTVYYQQFQQGQPVSCLFIASNNQRQEHHVKVIGFNEQLIIPSHDAPFRYGGAVSHAEMSDVAKVRFEQYVRQLSEAMGLVGLNSCDAICDGDAVYVLEINPRLSATMDLYTDMQLFEKHIAAVASEAVEFEQVCKRSRAQQVIYAEYKVTIKDDIIWPSWVYDRPKAGSFLDKGMPVCTVIAEAETAEQAKCLMNERAVGINREFLN